MLIEVSRSNANNVRGISDASFDKKGFFTLIGLESVDVTST